MVISSYDKKRTATFSLDALEGAFQDHIDLIERQTNEQKMKAEAYAAGLKEAVYRIAKDLEYANYRAKEKEE
jgi:hypothetical protein